MYSKSISPQVIVAAILALLSLIGCVVLFATNTSVLGIEINQEFLQLVKQQAIRKSLGMVCVTLFIIFLTFITLETRKTNSNRNYNTLPMTLGMAVVLLIFLFVSPSNNPFTYINNDPEIRIEECTNTFSKHTYRKTHYYATFGNQNVSVSKSSADSTIIGKNYYTVYFGNIIYNFYDPDIYTLSSDISIP